MPLSPMAYIEVRRRLLAAGFIEANQRGSHVKFIKSTDEGIRTAIVPRHREVAAGTLRSIIRQAGITADKFEQL
jgi:predicted RNA binding protein YcfA (HicA-like mRNA interferase family)